MLSRFLWLIYIVIFHNLHSCRAYNFQATIINKHLKTFILSSSLLFSSSSLTILPTKTHAIEQAQYAPTINSSNKSYITAAKEAFEIILNQLTLDSNMKIVYNDIDFIVRSYRLIDRLPLLITEATTSSNRQCIKDNTILTIEHIHTIQEYFSISNDSNSGMKYMISDTVPGQKVRFVTEGLNTVKYDLRKLLFCSN